MFPLMRSLISSSVRLTAFIDCQVRGNEARSASLHLVEKRNRRADLAGCAIPALQPIVFNERGLHRVQIRALRKAFNRCNLIAVVHGGKCQARVDAPSVDQNSTSSALAVIAALLCTGHCRFSRSRSSKVVRGIDLQPVRLPIDHQAAFERMCRRAIAPGPLLRQARLPAPASAPPTKALRLTPGVSCACSNSFCFMSASRTRLSDSCVARHWIAFGADCDASTLR